MRWAVWLVVGTTMLRATAAAAPPADVLGYAVFGIGIANVGGKSRVEGDVGSAGGIALGKGTRVGGAAAGPAITLGRGARAAAGYWCATLDDAPDGCMALPEPLVTTPTIVVVGAPSNSDVSAARRTKGSSPLAPGAYGTLAIGAAAELTLAGGAYQFESISLGARAKLLCRAGCTITVRGRVEVGQAARLGAADGVAPEAVRVNVSGEGQAVAFAARSRVTLRGSVYAPSGAVTLGASARVTGALVGASVTVGPRARLQASAPAS